ncbi:MAG: hypothetical protein JWM56_1041 [Candidatus Peribacteria bacterium]|nr:hypothetical protein [Candidatus Peribacteria bacterium]
MPIQDPQTNVLVVCAGMNEPSNSELLAENFMTGMKSIDTLHVQAVKLREKNIEHFTLAFYDPKKDQGKDFQDIQHSIEQAKGVVIVTPIWNFSVPAHLKNLIDRMGSFCLDSATHSKGTLGGKPFYLVFTGGSGNFVWNTVMENSTSHVREAIKYFGGTVIGTHFEEHCVNMDKSFGLVLDKRPEALEAAKKKGAEFGAIVKNFATTGALPASNKAKSLFYGIAQKVVKKLT